MEVFKKEKIGAAAEALLAILRESEAASAKVVLFDKRGKANAALILIEGEDTQAYIDTLALFEEKNGI